MSKQVLSIEQMHHLQELGLDTSKSSFCRFPLAIGLSDDGFPILSEKEYIISERKYESSFNYPAFTLQDILDLLPDVIVNDYEKLEMRIKRFVYDTGKTMYAVLYEKQDYVDWFIMYSDSILIDAAYEMLCWLIENRYVKTNKED